MLKKQIIIIAQTILALALTQGFVLFSVRAISVASSLPGSFPALTAQQFLIGFIISTAVLLTLIRTLRSRFVFETIFILSIFSGIWFLSTFVAPLYALFIAGLVVALRYIFPYVIAHNGAIILGIAGIGAGLGAATSWRTALVVLGMLAVYDIIAVYGTKHMVTMFKGLLSQGVIFALIIPEHPRLLLKRLKEVGPGEGFFFLGTGDLALPAFFVASAARESIALAVGAAIGSMVGLFFTDLLFQWGRKRPMPALPPIAAGTIAGFFVVKLVTLYV